MQDYFAFGSRTSKVDFGSDKKFRQNSKPFDATGLSGSWLKLHSQKPDDKKKMGHKDHKEAKRRKTWSEQQNDKKNEVETKLDADDETDAILAKQHKNIIYTIRKGVLPQTKGKKTHYYTARGKGFDMWDEQAEAQHEAKAHIRDTSALLKSHEWEKLVGKGITTLIIEDDDNVLKEIPPEVACIQTLRSFTLMWSKVKEIPPEVLEMSLKELCIQKCSLKIIDGIQQLQELRKLELSNDGLKKIPIEIGEMTTLTDLNLEGNSLKSVPMSIGNLHRLRTLKLCGNSLSAIPSSFASLAELSTLDISHNHIKELPEDLGNMSKLVTLRLSHNHLSSFPASMKNLIKLRHLYVGNNRFNDVPAVLAQLPELITLNMVSNNIDIIRSPMAHLTTLLLDRNQFTELPITLFSCTNLETLSLQFNHIHQIPTPIMCLTKLRSLYLTGNNIDFLPDELCQLKELRHLVMRETPIQELPSNFDSLRKLSLVDIEKTELNYQFAYALKNEGIEGLLEQVRISREQRDSVSDRGSSQFDSEDDPANDEEPQVRRTVHNPDMPVIMRDSSSVDRKEVLTFYPPTIEEMEDITDKENGEKPKEPVPHLSQIWQSENAFYLPNKEPEEDLTIGKAQGETITHVKFEMDVDNIPPAGKGILKNKQEKTNRTAATKDATVSKSAQPENKNPAPTRPKVQPKPNSSKPATRIDYSEENSPASVPETTKQAILRDKPEKQTRNESKQRSSKPPVKKKPQIPRDSISGHVNETNNVRQTSEVSNVRSSTAVPQNTRNSSAKPKVAPKPSVKSDGSQTKM